MMTTRLLATALATASLATGCVISSGDDATLEVSNESSYVIEEIYLTENYSDNWGADQLRGDVLFPGESFIFSVDCGYYDALLVDETGVECELFDLDLCFNDSLWVIRNNTCSVFARKQGETPVQSPEVAKQ